MKSVGDNGIAKRLHNDMCHTKLVYGLTDARLYIETKVRAIQRL